MLALAALAAAISMGTPTIGIRRASAHVAAASTNRSLNDAAAIVAARRRDDFAAMLAFRPGYPFWQHVFTLPDHSIAFGSAADGRLLATFPTIELTGEPRRTRSNLNNSLKALPVRLSA